MEDSWLLPSIQGHIKVRFGCLPSQWDAFIFTLNKNNCSVASEGFLGGRERVGRLGLRT